MTHIYNPNLKKVNTPVEFTKENIIEFQKCEEDPIYFMKNYMKIVSLDEGLVPFKMYDFQKHIVRQYMTTDLQFANYLDNQVSQQLPFRIYYTMHYLIQIVILPYLPISPLLLEIFYRVQFAYENLPKWLQQGVINWNKGNIELENKSQIVAAATSSSAIRGVHIILFS